MRVETQQLLATDEAVDVFSRENENSGGQLLVQRPRHSLFSLCLAQPTVQSGHSTEVVGRSGAVVGSGEVAEETVLQQRVVAHCQRHRAGTCQGRKQQFLQQSQSTHRLVCRSAVVAVDSRDNVVVAVAVGSGVVWEKRSI